MTVIPALGRLKQEHQELKARLGYSRSCLRYQKGTETSKFTEEKRKIQRQ